MMIGHKEYLHALARIAASLPIVDTEAETEVLSHGLRPCPACEGEMSCDDPLNAEEKIFLESYIAKPPVDSAPLNFEMQPPGRTIARIAWQLLYRDFTHGLIRQDDASPGIWTEAVSRPATIPE
jgi:hypothetical protein